MQDLSTYSPQRADLRLLSIPASHFQVSENDPMIEIFIELLQLALLFLIVISLVAHT